LLVLSALGAACSGGDDPRVAAVATAAGDPATEATNVDGSKTVDVTGSMGTPATIVMRRASEQTGDAITFFELVVDGEVVYRFAQPDVCIGTSSAMASVIPSDHRALAVGVVPRWVETTVTLSQAGAELATERFSAEGLDVDILLARDARADQRVGLGGIDVRAMESKLTGCSMGGRK
jgi:hypothetical protein